MVVVMLIAQEKANLWEILKVNATKTRNVHVDGNNL